MIDNLKNLNRHLKTQLAVADSLMSEFVYIRKTEAKKCLELVEAEQKRVKESDNERVCR